MSQDERPALVTIPTELERVDVFIDGAVLATTLLVGWYALQMGVPWPWLVPLVLVAACWTLTGEAFADVPYLGAIASGLRNMLGLRRAHEWVLAFGHYASARTIPDARAWWASSPSVPVLPKYPRIMVS